MEENSRCICCSAQLRWRISSPALNMQFSLFVCLSSSGLRERPPCAGQRPRRLCPEAAAVAAVPPRLRLQLRQLAPALQVRCARRAQLAPAGALGRSAGLCRGASLCRGTDLCRATDLCRGATYAALGLLLVPLACRQRHIQLAEVCQLACRDVQQRVAGACTAARGKAGWRRGIEGQCGKLA